MKHLKHLKQVKHPETKYDTAFVQSPRFSVRKGCTLNFERQLKLELQTLNSERLFFSNISHRNFAIGRSVPER